MRFLALVTDAFGGNGGIAKFNRDFLTALSVLPGCDEVIAMPRLMPSDSGKLPHKVKYVTSGIDNKYNYIAAVIKLLLGKNSIDLIICGHINLLPLAFFARLILRAPLVLVIHGIDAWTPTKSLLSNYLSGKIDYFISVSEITKKRFLDWSGLNGQKGFVLPNCIDLSAFGSGPKSEELLKHYGLQDRKIIMTMGRISADERYKGFGEVLEVLPALAEVIPNVSYMIVGEGSDRFALEEKAKALCVAERVVFTGWISEEEKADHFRLADLFVMPGKGEGFGIVYLEAMACGVPVIGSTADGSREALRDGELGVLVNPDSRDELTSSILEALAGPKSNVPKGLEYFDINNFEQRVRHIISAVMEGNRREDRQP